MLRSDQGPASPGDEAVSWPSVTTAFGSRTESDICFSQLTTRRCGRKVSRLAPAKIPPAAERPANAKPAPWTDMALPRLTREDTPAPYDTTADPVRPTARRDRTPAHTLIRMARFLVGIDLGTTNSAL